jgi:hypothetical protein
VRQDLIGAADTFGFKDAGRVLQIEVYLGPDIRPALRARVAVLLDSLRAAPIA